MKTPSILLIAASGLAIGMFSSCVVPVSGDGYSSATVTTSSYQPGYRLSTLPSGYRSEVISGNNYYYHDGYYYRSDASGYIVVDAPRTSRYYSEYDRHRSSSTYRTSSGPRGQHTEVRVISALPSGYRVVNHGGTQYYQSGEQYYRRQADGYITVSRPF